MKFFIFLSLFVFSNAFAFNFPVGTFKCTSELNGNSIQETIEIKSMVSGSVTLPLVTVTSSQRGFAQGIAVLSQTAEQANRSQFSMILNAAYNSTITLRFSNEGAMIPLLPGECNRL